MKGETQEYEFVDRGVPAARDVAGEARYGSCTHEPYLATGVVQASESVASRESGPSWLRLSVNSTQPLSWQKFQRDRSSRSAERPRSGNITMCSSSWASKGHSSRAINRF